MLGRIVLVVAVASVLGACGRHDDPDVHRPASSPRVTANPATHAVRADQLDCSAHISAHGPTASYRVILGAVALEVWPAAGVMQTSTTGRAGGVPALFAKTGLLVRAGVPSTITTLAAPHQVAQIGWRNGAITPRRRVEIPACPPDGTSRWLAFPGGYWVDRPACVRLSVDSGGETQTERVAVGKRCP